MEVKYCARCKKLFQYIGGPMLCPSCRDEEEKDFQRVKEFLRENPKATITEISESLDISVERINRYLREGRLEVAPGSPIQLECENCGAPITTGRYCRNCSSKLEKVFNETSEHLRNKSSAQTSTSAMKYLNNKE